MRLWFSLQFLLFTHLKSYNKEQDWKDHKYFSTNEIYS